MVEINKSADIVLKDITVEVVLDYYAEQKKSSGRWDLTQLIWRNPSVKFTTT